MDWLRENWFWIVVGALFLWVHAKMHGSHGAHEGSGGHAAHGRAGEQGRALDGDRQDGREEEDHARH